MKRKLLINVSIGVLVLAPIASQGQIERLTERRQDSYLRQLPELIQNAKNATLKTHLQQIANPANAKERQAAVNAVRVTLDVGETPISDSFVHYAIPPMSDVQRLKDMYPYDGEANVPVRIIAAQEEYEPGAFSIYPLKDLGKVTLELTPFKSKEGMTFPAEQMDLKLIKIWHQNKNAWYSYFGDTGFKLVAELLVNDEDLIKVDEEKQANYARLVSPAGKLSYQWINPPRALDIRSADSRDKKLGVFMPMRPDFTDATTLQPVSLNKGHFTTFFLTAHVTNKTRPGTYTGSIKLRKQNDILGEIPVAIRVLPFVLPSPKCYFDVEKDFLTTSYAYISLELIMDENGGDRELAKKQLRSVLQNMVAHNQMIHKSRFINGSETAFTIQTMKDVGMITDPIVGGASVNKSSEKQEMARSAKHLAKWFDTVVGHHNVYVQYGDEPGASWLVEARSVFEPYQREGFKFFIAGKNAVFYKTGYLFDWHNVAKSPEDDTSTRLWNEVGNAYVAWYAQMHVGPENPQFNRRQYGLASYLANYSATCNYAHHFGSYNDDRTTYRPMVFAYGIYGGVLDTLQWEGYREGIDDIRYATMLRVLAQKAARSEVLETRYAGNKAMQFVANLNREQCDLNVVRLEMIRFILQLKELI